VLLYLLPLKGFLRERLMGEFNLFAISLAGQNQCRSPPTGKKDSPFFETFETKSVT